MHSAPASQLLPHHVEAVRFCQHGGHLSGHVPLAQLSRLAQQLYAADGQAQVEWAFSLDEQSRRIIHGQIETVLPMVCQRCLDRVDVPISTETALALVWSDEQAALLPRTLDPVLMSDETLNVWDAVEDELLLALPIVAKHAEGSCQIAEAIPQQAVAELEADTEKRPNPFQVLASLKSGRDKTEM